jgi:hypothetical protein
MTPSNVLTVRKAIAVLKIPRSYDKQITYLNDIYNKMSTDSRYSGSSVLLTKFKDQIKDFSDAQIAFKAKPPVVTIEVRDGKSKLAVTTAHELKSDVQKLADADVVNAEEIITGANMLVKIINVRIPQQYGFEYDEDTNTLTFTAEGSGPHQWQSSDDGETWQNDEPTRTSTKVYPNELVSKVKYYRNRQMLTHGKFGPWSVALKAPKKF